MWLIPCEQSLLEPQNHQPECLVLIIHPPYTRCERKQEKFINKRRNRGLNQKVWQQKTQHTDSSRTHPHPSYLGNIFRLLRNPSRFLYLTIQITNPYLVVDYKNCNELFCYFIETVKIQVRCYLRRRCTGRNSGFNNGCCRGGRETSRKNVQCFICVQWGLGDKKYPIKSQDLAALTNHHTALPILHLLPSPCSAILNTFMKNHVWCLTSFGGGGNFFSSSSENL